MCDIKTFFNESNKNDVKTKSCRGSIAINPDVFANGAFSDIDLNNEAVK